MIPAGDIEDLVVQALRRKAETLEVADPPGSSHQPSGTTKSWRTFGVAAVLSAIVVFGGVGAIALFAESPAATRLFAIYGRPEEARTTFVEATIEDGQATISQTRELVGFTAAMTASADGAIVFVAGQTDEVDDSVPTSDTLTVIRADQEVRTEISLFDPGAEMQRLQTTAGTRPSITSSIDGTYVFVQSFTQGDAADQRFFLRTVDVEAGSLLPAHVTINGCRSWYQIVPTGGRDVAVLCPGLQTIELLSIAEDGSLEERRVISVELPPREGQDGFGSTVNLNAIAGGVLLEENALRVVTGGGAVIDVDISSGVATVAGNVQLPPKTTVTLAHVVATPAGELILGTHPLAQLDTGSSDAALVVEDLGLGPSDALSVGDKGIGSLIAAPNNLAVVGISPQGGETLILESGSRRAFQVVEGLPSSSVIYALAVEPKIVPSG